MERIPGVLDESLLLQATTTKTASFNSDGLDMGEGYDPDMIGQPVAGVVHVTGIDLSSGNETYTFKLQQSDDNSTFADIGLAVSANAAKAIACKGFVTKRYVRLVMTAGGTTPSITYAAWLRPFRLG